MTHIRIGSLGLALLLLSLIGGNTRLLGTATAEPFTAEQRWDLEKRLAAKQREAGRAESVEDFNTARQLRQDVLDLSVRLYGVNDWHRTDARLALIQVDVLAKLTASQRKQLREATMIHSSGKELGEKGKYREAEPLLCQALLIRQRILGEENPDTVRSRGDLAGSLNDQGKYADAEPLYRQALAICQKMLGEGHPDTARNYTGVAGALTAQGRSIEADPLAREGLTICQKLLGEDHPETARSYVGVANTLHGQGRYAEADPLYRKALAIRQEVLGEDHPDTGRSYNKLADNLIGQRKFAEAELLARKSLIISQTVVGEAHPDTATSYNDLALTLTHQRKLAEAEPLYRKALLISQDVLGEAHPYTAACTNNVGINLSSQGKHAEAEPLLRKAMAICARVLPEDHPTLVLGYVNVATNLANQGKYDEAETLLRKAVAICQQGLGKTYPHASSCYDDMAFTLSAQGKYEEATLMARAAVAIFQDFRHQVAFGGLERTTFTSAYSPWPLLATLLARAGQPEDAWRALEENLARGLLDDLNAQRRPLSADERGRLDDLRGRIDQLDKQHAALAGFKNLTPEQQQRRERLCHQRDRLQSDLTQFQGALRQKYGAAAGQVYELAHIQQRLPADAALLTWLDRKARPHAHDPNGDHWACLVRATGPPVWVPLAGCGPSGAWTAADDDVPADLRNQLKKLSDVNVWRDLAHYLAAQRLAPLEPYLRREGARPAVKHLIILPSDQMAGIPIEALTSRYSVSYAPSGTLFAYLQEQRLAPAAGQLLALADPVFPPAAGPAARPTPPAQGVVLAGVQPGANASRAGMRTGDVLLRYADTPLANGGDLEKAIAAHANARANTGIRVELWRDGNGKSVTVQPGPLDATLSSESTIVALRSRWEGQEAVRASRNSGSFAPLPGSRREVRAIAGLFKQHTLLLGSEASEQALDALAQANQLRQFRYLHLATHGEANAVNGLRSFLALAQDRLPDPLTVLPLGQKYFDGRLSAADIVRSWTLHADLVTLSGCETGLGRQQGGEGYVGFAQALILAGARSLVLSQWKVDDDATALLMVRFYQNLLGQRPGLHAPLGKAAALAEAKNWLYRLDAGEVRRLKDDLRKQSRGSEEPRPAEGVEAIKSERPYEHPYYWAGFILVGDPGDLTSVRPVLAEGTPLTPASAMASGRRWPWLLGMGGVGIGLIAGLVLRRRGRRAALLCCVLGVASLLLTLVIIRIPHEKGTLVIETNDQRVEIVVKQQGATIIACTAERPIELNPGDYEIELADAKDGLLSTKKFTLPRGGREIVKLFAETVADQTSIPPESVVRRHEKFTSIHGANSAAFEVWIGRCKETGYRPNFINGYTLGRQPRFAGIAIKDGNDYAWESRHDLNSAAHQQSFDELTAKGYRQISVTGYLDGGTLRYGAIWVRDGSPMEWRARHGRIAAQYQAISQENNQKGLLPIAVNGFPAGLRPRFAAIFTNEDLARVALHDLTAEQYQQACNDWTSKGYRPVSISGYQTGATTRFAVVFIQDKRVREWQARHDLTPEKYQEMADTWTAQGYQPLVICGYTCPGTLRYATIWVKDLEPVAEKMPQLKAVVRRHEKFTSIHGANAAAYEAWIGQCKEMGYRPIFINGYTVGKQPRFAGIAIKDRDKYAWESRHDLNLAVYQQSFDELPSKGYRPISLTGYLDGGTLRYGAIWVRDGSSMTWWATYGRSASQYQATSKEKSERGLLPIAVSGYPAGLTHQFSAIFTNEELSRVALHDLTAEQYRRAYNDWTSKGYRPIRISGYQTGETTRFAVVFVQDKRVREWEIRHDLTPEKYQEMADTWTAKGYQPLVICGYTCQGTLRYATIWVKPVAAKMPKFEAVVRRHEKFTSIQGANAAAYEAWIGQCKQTGYRPIFINGYTVGKQPYFAAIAIKDGKDYAWESRHGVTSASLSRTTNEELTPNGYRPISITGYLDGSTLRYGAIWVRDGGQMAWRARYGVTAARYPAICQENNQKGLLPIAVNGFPAGVTHQFAGIFTNEILPRVALHDLTAEQYQRAYNDWTSNGYRPVSISGYPTGEATRFAVVFVQDKRMRDWEARHNLTPEKYQEMADTWTAKGYQPLVICGYAWEGTLRYATIWVRITLE
jgi:tetratricopeptide (TPR) repeat protein